MKPPNKSTIVTTDKGKRFMYIEPFSPNHFNQRNIAATRRRVLWIWTAFIGWLFILSWLMHRFGAL